MAKASGNFEVVSAHRGSSGGITEGWCELLINGLTFDLTGISPAQGEAIPERVHAFDLGDDTASVEAITLRPGPHLSGGAAMPPVVRCLALLGANLADLPGATAVAWHPARAWSSARYFRQSVLQWVEGGAFPGLGLTAFARAEGGGLQSEGLALFTGRELRIEPDVAASDTELTKIGLRLLHWLVENGGIGEATALTGPSGEALQMRPDPDAGLIVVRRTG